MPAVRDDVVHVACPVASSEADPSVVVSSMKVTVPVGAPDPMTFAVKVIPAPKAEGLIFDATLIDTGGSLIASVTVAVWLWLPLVPVIVRRKLPVGVVRLDVISNSEDPDFVTDGGVKFALAPVGSSPMLKSTVPSNPSAGARVTV